MQEYPVGVLRANTPPPDILTPPSALQQERAASHLLGSHLAQPGIASVASRQRGGVGKAGRSEARKSAGCVSHETLRFTGEGGYLGLRSYDRARALALVRCARVDIVNNSRCLHTLLPHQPQSVLQGSVDTRRPATRKASLRRSQTPRGTAGLCWAEGRQLIRIPKGAFSCRERLPNIRLVPHEHISKATLQCIELA